MSAHGGKRRVSLAYTLAPGESLSLVERGTRSEHTIAARVRGHRCPGPTRQGGERLFCASVMFVPAFGSAGRRTILAVVTRDGVPVQTVAVASFTTPRPLSRSGHRHACSSCDGAAASSSHGRESRARRATRPRSPSVTAGSWGGPCPPAAAASCSGASPARSRRVRRWRPCGPISSPARSPLLRLRSNASRSGASGSVPAPIC